MIVYYQSIIITVFVLFFIAVYREKPAHPPSEAALTIKTNFAGSSLFKEIFNMAKLPNFMWLCVAFSILYSTTVAVGVIISPLFSYFGYGTSFQSLGGALCILTGVVASVPIGKYLDVTKNYVKTLRILAFTSCFVFFNIFWVAPLKNDWICGALLVIAGVATIPVTPLGFIFSIELTHPIQPVLVNGFLLMCAQICSLVMSVVMSAIVGKHPWWVLIIFAVLMVVASFAAIMTKQELRLTSANREAERKSKELQHGPQESHFGTITEAQ